jgi:hypothetical protein
MPTHQKHRLTKPASEHRSLDHRLRNAVEVDRDAAKQAIQVVKSAAIGAITATVSQNTAPRVGVPTSVPDVRDIRCHRQPVQKSPDCESNEQPNEELGHRHTCVDSDISSDSKQEKTLAKQRRWLLRSDHHQHDLPKLTHMSSSLQTVQPRTTLSPYSAPAPRITHERSAASVHDPRTADERLNTSPLHLPTVWLRFE